MHHTKDRRRTGDRLSDTGTIYVPGTRMKYNVRVRVGTRENDTWYYTYSQCAARIIPPLCRSMYHEYRIVPKT